VIADMTGRNPNVFYEVGYAHALGKTTILLTNNSDDIPFDLKHYPHIIYNNRIKQLKDELTTKVKWYVDNISNQNVNLNIEIDVYFGESSLSNRNVEYRVDSGNYPTPTLTLHNKSFTTFNPDNYCIGILTDDNYPYAYCGETKCKTTKLPNGQLMHMLPPIEEILYPNLYTGIEVVLIQKVLSLNMFEPTVYYRENQEITIRIFTSNGTRDFFMMITY